MTDSDPSWFSDARTLVTASSFGAVLALATDGPRVFFEDYFLPWFSETAVGWILSGIVWVFEEVVQAARLIGGSAYEGFVVPFADLGAAVNSGVDAWIAWQTGLAEAGAGELGLAGPFVSLGALTIVLVANVLLATLLWDVANDYLPLQLVTEPVLGALATFRETAVEGASRLLPPYGGNDDE